MKYHIKNLYEEKGFTLAELLVALGISSVLFASVGIAFIQIINFQSRIQEDREVISVVSNTTNIMRRYLQGASVDIENKCGLNNRAFKTTENANVKKIEFLYRDNCFSFEYDSTNGQITINGRDDFNKDFSYGLVDTERVRITDFILLKNPKIPRNTVTFLMKAQPTKFENIEEFSFQTTVSIRRYGDGGNLDLAGSLALIRGGGAADVDVDLSSVYVNTPISRLSVDSIALDWTHGISLLGSNISRGIKAYRIILDDDSELPELDNYPELDEDPSEIGDAPRVVCRSRTKYTFNNLLPNTEYTVAVFAMKNRDCSNDPEGKDSGLAPQSKRTKIAGITDLEFSGAPTDNTLDIQWSNTDLATHYRVAYNPIGGSEQIRCIKKDEDNTQTKYTAEGLTPDTVYEFRVAPLYIDIAGTFSDASPECLNDPLTGLVTASYNFGDSGVLDYREEIKTTLDGKLPKVRDPTIIRGATNMLFLWDVIVGADAYRLSLDDDPDINEIIETGDDPEVLCLSNSDVSSGELYELPKGSLVSNTEYTIRINALRDAANCSLPDPPGGETYITTRVTKLGGINNLRLLEEPTSTTISIQWDRVDGASYYLVHVPGSPAIRQCDENQTTFTKTSLSPGRLYTFTVTPYFKENFQRSACENGLIGADNEGKTDSIRIQTSF